MMTSNASIALHLSRVASVVACLFAGTIKLQAQESATYDKSKIQQIYMSFLASEGYVPTLDDDGDYIRFKKEGRSYYIAINESDPKFFQLIFPGFWDIESEAERQQALLACNAANLKTKVSKVYIPSGSVWASVELFVEEPEKFRPVFKRALSALDAGVENFVDKMREK